MVFVFICQFEGASTPAVFVTLSANTPDLPDYSNLKLTRALEVMQLYSMSSPLPMPIVAEVMCGEQVQKPLALVLALVVQCSVLPVLLPH